MRQLLFFPVLLFLLVSCNSERPQMEPSANTSALPLRIKGSETMKPLMTGLLEKFGVKTMQSPVMYDATGSNAAVLAFERDEADLIALSRALTEEEKTRLGKNGDLEIVVIGYDGLDILVNRSNKVNRLTLTQLRNIYTGKITSWDEVGGEHYPIKAYSRDANSGTFDFFKNHVLDSLNYRPDDVNCNSNEAIIAGVKNDPQGIGYAGTGFNIKEVKPLELSGDDGKTWYDSRKQNIRNQVYPITRPYYIAYYSKNKEKLSPLVSFILSSEGQKQVEQLGFIAAYSSDIE